jgi:hypothetical protein
MCNILLNNFFFCLGTAGLPDFPFGATSQIPGMNLYFVVNMEPSTINETFHILKIGLEVQACLNHSAIANANVRKSKELGKRQSFGYKVLDWVQILSLIT